MERFQYLIGLLSG